LAVIVVEREIGRHVGKQGHALDDFCQRRQAAQVAQNKVRHGAVAQAAQSSPDGFVIGELAL
jgi:hypothetical protein